MSIKIEAIIEDLYRVPENGKAEIVNGELVLMAATGFMPRRASKVEVVRVYRASNPDQPQIYHRGEVAEAEPAVPGSVMVVDDLFV